MVLFNKTSNRQDNSFSISHRNVCAGTPIVDLFFISQSSSVHCFCSFIFLFVRIMFVGKSYSFHVIIQFANHLETLNSFRSLTPSSPAMSERHFFHCFDLDLVTVANWYRSMRNWEEFCIGMEIKRKRKQKQKKRFNKWMKIEKKSTHKMNHLTISNQTKLTRIFAPAYRYNNNVQIQNKHLLI